MSGFLQTMHRPDDCLMLVAFPLTEEQFVSDLSTDSRKDYAKQEAKKYRLTPHFLWEYDQLPLVKVIESTCDAVEKMGVTVIPQATMGDFTDLSRFHVVTPFAHYNHNTEQVELSDRMYPVDEFVAAFDNRFTGYCDLSICNSTILQDKLKEKLGDRVFSRANQYSAEIKVHLILYKYLMQSLHRNSLNYLSEQLRQRTLFSEYLKKKV